MKIPKKIKPEQAFNEDAVIASAASYADSMVACGEGFIPGQADVVPEVGSRFEIDLLIPEEIETGDAREFAYNSLTSRDFPLPLYWQIATGEGHSGSVIVGRIDYAERLGDEEVESIDFADSVGEVIEDIPENDELHKGTPKGWGHAVGVFDTGPYGREAERLVRGGFLRGVSADLDKFEAAMELAAEDEDQDGEGKIKNEKMKVTNARLMGATLLGKPAFQECTIRLVDDEPLFEELPLEDGMYEEEIDDPEFFEASLVASAAPVVPPRDWFSNPRLSKPTPITVTDEGKVFGHIASWQVNHIGYMGKAQKPPRSLSNYAYFRTGVLRTDDSTDVPVGQLTLSGGHADMSLNAAAATKHYDDTNSAVADVSAGEDAFGIWVSGSLRPDVTAAQVRALRASAPSGDWRPINGRLELVAVCQVNVPGFPVARTMVAGGQVLALTAAGARPIAELRNQSHADLDSRLSAIEKAEFEKKREAALSAIAPIKQKRDTELSVTVQDSRALLEEMRANRDAELANRAEIARKAILGE